MENGKMFCIQMPLNCGGLIFNFKKLREKDKSRNMVDRK